MSSSQRAPAVAGRFYPSDPVALREEVRTYLDAAEPPALDGPVIGVVAPHAGIMYSGPVAAHSYRALASQDWDAVLLIGGSHHYALANAHVFAHGSWATPIETFPVAEGLAAELIASDERIVDDPVPHGPEHSLEVQLPFLAETIGPIPVVPVLVSPSAPEACIALGEAVGRLSKDQKIAIVASTDLSHYHAYDLAHERDHAAIEAICAWNPHALARDSADQRVEVCGGGAVAAAEIAAAQRGATQATLLNYATSGDVEQGLKDRVVGYAALALVAGPRVAQLAPLTDVQQRQALTLARETFSASVLGQRLPTPGPDDPRFREPQGVFVTLRLRSGALRGCLGQAENPLPVTEGIMRYTEAAASRDPRFPPVQASELGEIHIEVSLLSPLEILSDPTNMTIGEDGLVVRRGKSGGLLLPQVAPAQGWNRDEFLRGICRKAGLPAEAWRWDGTELYRFTAQVFGEPGIPA